MTTRQRRGIQRSQGRSQGGKPHYYIEAPDRGVDSGEQSAKRQGQRAKEPTTGLQDYGTAQRSCGLFVIGSWLSGRSGAAKLGPGGSERMTHGVLGARR